MAMALLTADMLTGFSSPSDKIPPRRTALKKSTKISENPPNLFGMSQRGTNAQVIAALEGLIGKNSSFEGLATIFKQIEKCLYSMTSSSSAYTDVLQNWSFIRDLRRLLGVVALKLIQKDVVQAEQLNFDYRLWMRGFYDVFHAIRHKHKSKTPQSDEVKGRMQDIFKHGKRIFKDITSIYEIMLNKEKPLASHAQSVHSAKMNAIISSTYKVYTYIADLHRYESSVEDKKQLSEAAIRYYDQAIRLIPDRYRAYHNLAIVHKSQNDLVATAYNFLRGQCLEGGESSRQELLELFDDLNKHYRRHEDTFWHYQCRKNQKYDGRQSYKTYWVSTDETVRRPLPPAFAHPQFKEEHLEPMDDRELYRKFSQSYCVFLGIIYTKIGLESLELLAEDVLVYFQELLQRKSEFLPTLRVVQITAMIIYMIHFIGIKHKPRSELEWEANTTNKKLKAHPPPDWKIAAADKPVAGVDDAQHMENVATDFALEMFSLLAQYLSDILRLCDWRNPLLTPVSAGLQLWEGWLRNNSQLWAFATRRRPVFCIRRLMRSKMENMLDNTDDVWTAFAELMNQVEIVVFEFAYLFPKCKKTQSVKYPMPIAKLPEYSALTGFHVFASNALTNCEFFTSEHAEPEKAFLFIRLVSLCEFGDQLCTKVKILEKVGGWNKVNQYTSIAKIVQWDTSSKDSCGLKEGDYQQLLTKGSENLRLSHDLKSRKVRRLRSKEVSGDCNNARYINKVRTIPAPLVPQRLPKEPKRARMPNYELWILMAEYGYPTELIVYPKRVVMDTNCLIRDLPIIESLMPYLRYPLFLPVTVILELRGLSKGGLTNKQKKIYGSVDNPEAKDAVAKNEIVAEQCKLALKYIEYRMSSFQIVTSTGKLLRPKTLHEHLQDDYFNPEDSNDERILDSCKFLEYADYQARKMDTPTRVFRNTVLLTGDLILSGRTITLDIPTRRTGSFAQWFFNAHDMKLNPRYLWGIEYNPEEEYGLRYQARYGEWSKDTGEEEYDDYYDEVHGKDWPKSQFVLVKPRNRKRGKNQVKGRFIIELHPQRFTL